MKKDFLLNDVWVTNACLVIVLIGILIFAFVDIKRLRFQNSGKSFRLFDGIATATFLIYILIVLYATLIGRVELGYYKHIFDPLYSYQRMFEGSKIAFYDNIQNILFFIPFGIYLFYFFYPRMKWYLAFLIAAVFSGVIEITQLYCQLGCGQTADVINNALGGLVGFFIAFLLDLGIQKNWDESEKSN